MFDFLPRIPFVVALDACVDGGLPQAELVQAFDRAFGTEFMVRCDGVRSPIVDDRAFHVL
ncbi:hypothetical protein M9978_22550 [Sphingomonas sp. MG17]|uniref:Uncharacterized protein n=1 Tax=Sphingomonas tagetis TaxID=2949092 RepID=A0A9X2HTG6_9SPHN|nr:hypothetical protein [Sphingomonas tagetis]MCP3733188.1 hypothetical protein [Sphingomonas tagetis]